MVRLTAKPVVSGMRSSANRKSPSEVATTPTSLDVLCGRCNERASHPGNRLFSFVVSKYVEQYALAEGSKKEKMRVSKAALDELFMSGVRFLKKHPTHQHWYVASQKVGRDKIGFFLREHLPKAIPSSENGRSRQIPASTCRPLPSTSPLTRFLVRERASPHDDHPESMSTTCSVWSKLDDLQEDTALLLARDKNKIASLAFVPTEQVPSFQSPVCSHGNVNIDVRSSLPKETLNHLFASSASNKTKASTPLSLRKETLDMNKKVQTCQRWRQGTPLSFLVEKEEPTCVPVKYQSTSLETLPSIGSFSSFLSSEVPRGVDLLLSSQFSWRSDLSRDAFELALCAY